MAKNLNIQTPVVDSYGNPVLNIEEDSSLSVDTSTVENYASPVLVVDDATADYVAYIEFGGSGDITNYYTKAEVDAIIAHYATKEEMNTVHVAASQVVNAGTKNSLKEAIMSIKVRVPLQIVTFINTQKAQRKRVVVWFGSLPNDGQMRVFIGSVASEWFNLVGSTIEKRNRIVYDSIINDPDLSPCIYSSSFSADYHQMIFVFTESVGGADIITEQRNNSSIVSMTTYNITSDFVEGLESYQFKLDYQASTSDALFENPDNWEEYNKEEEEQDATWEEF